MNYPPYAVRSFTYLNEQVRLDEVQRVIVYNMNATLTQLKVVS
jgi:hypothetical protein